MAWFYWLILILVFIGSLSGAVEAIIVWYMRIKDWYRRRKVDRRIIAQTKAVGVWDKEPIVLGGRALELKAWQEFKMKREPGETDAKLRGRYIAACNDYHEGALVVPFDKIRDMLGKKTNQERGHKGE